jgi:hypothetical protein
LSTLRLATVTWLLLYGVSVESASAQAGGPVPIAPATLAAPELPETMSRSADGQVIVRAVRTTDPIRVDGQLDEAIYSTLRPITGFVQSVPREGEAATEKTEAWILFDNTTLYIAGRIHDSAPASEWVANELRRDTNQLRQNDTFGVLFDTFHDRRSGFAFYTNALGALADYAIVDEGIPNSDWNPVWSVRTGRFDGGWTVEMAIPFKTLRYTAGSGQTWGVQFRRAIRRKNEWTYLTQVPAAMGGPQGLNRVSLGATLVGLDLPSATKNIELKPYGISRVESDRLRVPAVTNDFDPDAGIDAKIGVTANLTADVTYNTDFAQVEIDEQQVNLTRFSLFFPEKREFFLEGRGLFDFGRGGGFVLGNQPPSGASSNVVPSLFYSRRIGLNRNRVIPIEVGGRLSGKAGKYGIGIMNLQTDDEQVSNTPDTNFTVIRVKRDILRRSSVGAMFTNRSASNVADGSNQAYGVDAAFGFYQTLAMGGYYARTSTPGRSGDTASYQGRFEYNADRYGARADYLYVGDNFNPEVGYVQRDNFRRSFGSLRFSPRPQNVPHVRKFTTEASLEYLTNTDGTLETRQQIGRFQTEFESSDLFTVEARNSYELLVAPFNIATGVVIPRGAYSFGDVQLQYQFGAQRRASGTVSFQRGNFYDGDITAVGYSTGRVSVTTRFSLEPSFSINRVELPTGRFTSKVFRTRGDYGFSPRMFVSAFLQYASADRAFSTNLRFRWEYQPGSELFVVYTDERDTTGPRYPTLKNRAFVVKATRLFRF